MGGFGEEVVTMQTARLLRQAGFDLPCCGYYLSVAGKEHFLCYGMEMDHNASMAFSAPTQSLAARWIREKGWHVFCEVTEFADWLCRIDRIRPFVQFYYVSKEDYPTYEEAMEDGLRRALKQIIKEDKDGKKKNRKSIGADPDE